MVISTFEIFYNSYKTTIILLPPVSTSASLPFPPPGSSQSYTAPTSSAPLPHHPPRTKRTYLSSSYAPTSLRQIRPYATRRQEFLSAWICRRGVSHRRQMGANHSECRWKRVLLGFHHCLCLQRGVSLEISRLAGGDFLWDLPRVVFPR